MSVYRRGISKAQKFAIGSTLVLVAGVGAAALSSWAATASGFPVGVQPAAVKVISGDEATEVFAAEVADFQLALPSGVDWPESLPSNLLEKGVGMEWNVPRSVVSFYWLCAWEDDYVNGVAAGDAGRAADAIVQIEQFVDLPFYQEQFEDPTNIWYSTVVDAAKKGSLEGIKTDLNGCAYYFANQK